MPRPRKPRRVSVEPGVTYFKPRAVPLAELEEVRLTVSELESIRLHDCQEMDQKQAAEKMGISQPTFNRLLKSARKKIAEALSEGKAIRVEGGEYTVKER
jgi:predicted DNA-binding protein (UPF0251 family)